MNRFKVLNPDNATGKAKELFTAINSKLGVVPNMMKTMGQAPAMLEGYLGLNAALGTGTLGLKTGILLSLVVAESNGCNYCLSVHSYLGSNLAKIDNATLNAARNGHATDPKTEAMLRFAQAIVLKKGKVSEDDLQVLQAAGVSEAETSEVIGHVALNILTNYYNLIANTEIDFPLVETGVAIA